MVRRLYRRQPEHKVAAEIANKSLLPNAFVTPFVTLGTTQALFRTLTGQQQQPQLAVVVSTLAIAALFNPLRRRV